MIDNGIIPKLIPLLKDEQLLLHQLLDNEEKDTTLSKAVSYTRVKAACACANVINGGNMKQVKHVVDQGCIAPMLDLLTVAADYGKPEINTILKALENVSRE